MGFLKDLHGSEPRSMGAGDDHWYSAVMAPTVSGTRVTPESSLECVGVYACVRVLAESVSTLPLKLYRELEHGSKGKMPGKELSKYNLMHRKPHPNITTSKWLNLLVTHTATTGNHYSEVVRDAAGGIAYLLPWSPSRTEVKTSPAGKLCYELTQTDGTARVVMAEDMLHFTVFTWDGINGISPITKAREAVGLAQAAEEFGARFYGNGAHPGLVVTTDANAQYEKEDWDRLKTDINKNYAGLSNAHNALILSGGMKAEEVGIPPQDAQYIETRRYQKAEIASIYRVPLHMIQEVSGSTSWGSGIHEMTQGFVNNTLRPWLVMIEQVLNDILLTPAEKEDYFFEFRVEGLLRGDPEARSKYYDSMIQNQAMTPNEIRRLEGMNWVEWGDEPVRQENIFGKEDGPPVDGDDEEKKSDCGCGVDHRGADTDITSLDDFEMRAAKTRPAIQASYADMIADAMARVLKKERSQVTKAAERSMRTKQSLVKWIEEYYETHPETVTEMTGPAMRALAKAVGTQAMVEIGEEWKTDAELREWVDGFIASFSLSYSRSNRTQLIQVIEDSEPVMVEENIGIRFDEWLIAATAVALTRSEKIGAAESTKLGEKFAHEVWRANGITKVRWVNTGGDSCPYCKSLNNRVVGIEKAFIREGEDFKPDGAETPLTPSMDVYSPPAHGGCVCTLVAVKE